MHVSGHMQPTRDRYHAHVPSSRPVFLLALTSVTLALSACITEKVPVPKPLAQPASSKSTTNASTRLSFTPLGSVPYDGWTLPLVSPDARFIATQTGPPLSPAELLAQSPAPLVSRTIRIFRIAGTSPPETSTKGPAAPILVPMPAIDTPPGVSLGRSAHTRGVLVERSGPGPARDVGFLEWISGKITWLPSSGEWNGLATLLPESSQAPVRIACVRLPPPGTQGESVILIRALSGAEPDRTIALPGVNLMLPLATAEATRLYALGVPTRAASASSPRSLWLYAFDLAASPKLLDAVDLREGPTLDAALHIAAPAQSPWPSASAFAPMPAGVAVYSSQERRVQWFAPGAGLFPLQRSSAAGVPLLDARSSTLALATDRQLLAVVPSATSPLSATTPTSSQSSSPWASSSISILAGAAVPRSVIWQQRGALIAMQTPDSGASSELQIILISPESRASDGEGDAARSIPK